ncbi:hypothetical protein PTTG_05109 [Puccinia triticina 1-1 BBBD Race 1]|uniref:WD_REPEATS_REGION domain-containing protein n=2 Tax=Puccinia triticina TaxID=208348 RepID=A0A180GFF2_PUCT1|nr:hypothetical protein PTTG_05109 [Puccinia triticina 1-1 BBBD Race 1]WAR63738.1 hypothetical protein PtB15_17B339 [Puccinia triticina]
MLPIKSASKKRKRVKVVDGASLKSKKPLGIEEYPNVEPTAEELDLEEAVFGFAPVSRSKQKLEPSNPTHSVRPDDESPKTELAGLADDQLFILDEPNQQSNGAESLNDPNQKSETIERKESAPKTDRRPEKVPAWKDESANQVSVSISHGPSRLKKLRTLDDRDDDQKITISGEEYEKRLRTQFEKMNPTPTWLSDRRQSKGKQIDGDEDEDQPGFGLDLILQSTGDLNRPKISKKTRKGILPKGQLQVERLRDANQAEPGKTKSSPISCLQFHPHSDVLFTASAESKRLSFFKIDGTHNPALHFVHTPDLPIQAAEFCPPSTTNVSSTVLITGHRPYFYTFDLQSCQCIKSPQGLFHKSVFSQSSKGTSLSHFKFSPQGNLVAFVGMNGLVELVDWSNNIGSSQVIHSLKSNNPIKSLAWSRNGTELLTIGSNAEVSIWDLRMNKIMGSWFDDGGFNPTKISTTDQDCRRLTQESYTAIGSQTGIVNLYADQIQDGAPSSFVDSFQTSRKPFKTIGNLTTSINRLKFNPDAQVLGISSQVKKDGLKLVHVKSGTVFSNWPTSNTPLGHVTDFDFSHNSKYLVTANNRGKVLLYSLKFWE